MFSTKLKQVAGGAVLMALLILGALFGLGLPSANGTSAVPAAYADGCDNYLPPPFLDCLDTPTPTPTATPTDH